MSAVLRLSAELVDAAKAAAEAQLRSVPKQIEYWARLGRELEERQRAMQLIDPMTLMLAPAQLAPRTEPVDLRDPRQWAALPGAELVEQGVADAELGQRTKEALLVSIAAPRFERLGLDVPGARWPEPEHGLYRLLRERHGDGAHSKYNALIRRLNSFADALACATL